MVHSALYRDGKYDLSRNQVLYNCSEPAQHWHRYLMTKTAHRPPSLLKREVVFHFQASLPRTRSENAFARFKMPRWLIKKNLHRLAVPVPSWKTHQQHYIIKSPRASATCKRFQDLNTENQFPRAISFQPPGPPITEQGSRDDPNCPEESICFTEGVSSASLFFLYSIPLRCVSLLDFLTPFSPFRDSTLY